MRTPRWSTDLEEHAADWYAARDDDVLDEWCEDPCRASYVAAARGMFPTVEHRPDEAHSAIGEGRGLT
jgi:hypothetical protein